jgi:hypothetical protein
MEARRYEIGGESVYMRIENSYAMLCFLYFDIVDGPGRWSLTPSLLGED